MIKIRMKRFHLIVGVGLLGFASLAHAFDASWGYVKQVYVQADGDSAIKFEHPQHCAGPATPSTYYKVAQNHAAHDRLFSLLQAAQLNGVKVAFDYTCANNSAWIGTARTEGMN